MSIDNVRRYLDQWGRGKDVMEFAASSATVMLAAQALGVDSARIAKTLSFKTAAGCILLVAAGDSRVNNRKYKERFGHKAKMLSPEEAFTLTGHPVGGICPFALPANHIEIYLDNSLKRFDTVFPACGSPNSGIELTCSELAEYSQALDWVDICD